MTVTEKPAARPSRMHRILDRVPSWSPPIVVAAIVLAVTALVFSAVDPAEEWSIDRRAILGFGFMLAAMLAAYMFRERHQISVVRTLVDNRTAELRETNAKHQRSNAKFEALIDASPYAVACIDSKGAIVIWSATAERLFGYLRSELLGQPLEILLPERYRALHSKLQASFFGNPQSRKMGVDRDLYGLRKDGSEFPVEIDIKPIETDEGMMALSTIVDITEQRQKLIEAYYLAAAVESSNDAIIGKNTAGIITTWNASAERLFGYTADEAIGRHITFFIPPNLLGEEDVIFTRIKTGERVEHYETLRLAKDGREINVSLTISPIRGPGGEIIGSSKIARDITERMRSHRQLVRERDTAQRYLDLAGAVILELDVAGKITLVNQRGCVVFGYDSPKDIIGLSFVDTFIPEPLRPEIWDTFRRLVGGNDTNVEFYTSPALTKTGEERLIAWHNSLLRDENGKIAGTLSSGEDITERTRLEERFRRVVESAPSGMIMTDGAGCIEMINAQSEHLFGYSRAELLGQSIEILVPERFRGPHAGLRSSFFADPQSRGMAVDRDIYGLRKDGSEFPLEIGLTPIETHEGTMVVSSIVDISDRKHKEDRIQAALKEKDLLLSEIHHRVKNNLQVIHSLLELQSSKLKDDLALQLLTENQNRIKSMALIHQTLYESKDFARVDFNIFLDTLVSSLLSSYGADSERITLSVEARDVSLSINAAIPCGLILNELISNALKHAFPNGTRGEIKVELANEANNQVVLSVSDNGVGIPEELDLENATTLGLQLVTLLADQLGGTITLHRSNPTCFLVRFGSEQ